MNDLHLKLSDAVDRRKWRESIRRNMTDGSNDSNAET